MDNLIIISEYNESDFEPIQSFHLQDDINRNIYDEDDKMFGHIRHQLMEIATEFYSSSDLSANILDIILVGSLANYNWSEKYSDFDLHIVIDFTDVNEDVELVKRYADYAKKIWNLQNDILIENFEVEVYIQDISEALKSSGQYSILNNKWLVRPTKANFLLDENTIRIKAEPIMSNIEALEKQLNKLSYHELTDKVAKIWDKIKKFRKEGLETDLGEFSVGNLVFKFLRRNGFIERIINLKQQAYTQKFK